MVCDLYMIILTALAIFGLYSIAEEIVYCFNTSKMVDLLVILDGSDEIMAIQTVNYLQNLMINANVMVITDKKEVHNSIATITKEELIEYITNDLFTKN